MPWSHSRSRPLLRTIQSRVLHRMRGWLSPSWLQLLQRVWFGGKNGEKTTSLYVTSRQYNAAFPVQATGFRCYSPSAYSRMVASLTTTSGLKAEEIVGSECEEETSKSESCSARIGPL
jgi:hypothetical protein